MNACLRGAGGGIGKGRGCAKFEVFVYHIYTYGLVSETADVDCFVYEVFPTLPLVTFNLLIFLFRSIVTGTYYLLF